MAHHELKTDPDVFDAVVRGEKTFAIRQNHDRDYQVGDWLQLKKTVYSGEQMAEGKPLEYTGDEIGVRASYILRGPRYGLADGWVIMSIQ